ncbi:hypothetical protein ACE0DR_06030 [Azotobacter sp. CWF10]
MLDEIARQVELILLRDDTLGGTASDLRYSQTQMVLSEQGKTVIGACRIIFDADYLDEQPGPDFNETLDDLATVTPTTAWPASRTIRPTGRAPTSQD